MGESVIDILRRGANEAWELGLTEAQSAQFARFAELLVEWNATRKNLTRLTAPRDIGVEHFLDSLAVLKAMRIPAKREGDRHRQPRRPAGPGPEDRPA